MQLPLTERFQSERRRYRLACGCEDCSYFDPRGDRCAHGYPNARHRTEAFGPGRASDLQGVFCKEFELA